MGRKGREGGKRLTKDTEGDCIACNNMTIRRKGGFVISTPSEREESEKLWTVCH